MRIALLLLPTFVSALVFVAPLAQTQATAPKQPETVYLLKPAYVFDGESAQLHECWCAEKRLKPPDPRAK
jgi:hypothetical protein